MESVFSAVSGGALGATASHLRFLVPLIGAWLGAETALWAWKQLKAIAVLEDRARDAEEWREQGDAQFFAGNYGVGSTEHKEHHRMQRMFNERAEADDWTAADERQFNRERKRYARRFWA